MSWIESHQALEKHPKTLDLAQRMGWTLDETIGKLHRFWWWCLDYATDGDLRKHSVAVLAGSVGIQSASAEDFIKHMVEARWIDKKPYRRVHDWWEYCGRYLQVRYKHNPARWQEVREVYQNSSNNGSRNGSKTPRKHRSKNHIPTNLNQPTTTNQPQHFEQDKSASVVLELKQPDFERVWNAFPPNDRKVGKSEVRKWFEKKKPSEEIVTVMLEKLQRLSQSDQWKREGGKFIPSPMTWLHQQRWEDDVNLPQRAIPKSMLDIL